MNYRPRIVSFCVASDVASPPKHVFVCLQNHKKMGISHGSPMTSHGFGTHGPGLPAVAESG